MTKDTPGPPFDAPAPQPAPRAAPRSAADGATNPLDRWLRRELETLYAEDPGDTLPPRLADLAARLEAALSRPDAEPPDAELPDHAAPDDRD